MKYRFILCIGMLIVLNACTSCDLLGLGKKEKKEEPTYKADIEWEVPINIPDSRVILYAKDSIFLITSNIKYGEGISTTDGDKRYLTIINAPR